MEFRVKLTSHVRNFRQILMEHSYLMYKLVISRNSSKLKEMMNIWVEINSLTDEWAYKITCKNNDIGKEIRELIMSYSDVMCNVIIERHVDEKKIENIIKLEAKFLSVIGKMCIRDRSRKSLRSEVIFYFSHNNLSPFSYHSNIHTFFPFANHPYHHTLLYHLQ